MTLASFYRKRERWDEMESRGGKRIQSGAARSARGSCALQRRFGVCARQAQPGTRGEDAGGVSGKLSDERRRRRRLRRYTRLARLKAQLGDKNGAWQARAAALKLAHDYKPALGLTF